MVAGHGKGVEGSGTVVRDRRMGESGDGERNACFMLSVPHNSASIQEMLHCLTTCFGLIVSQVNSLSTSLPPALSKSLF